MATTTTASTSITVRVQAKGGKFLADDIGGSYGDVLRQAGQLT